MQKSKLDHYQMQQQYGQSGKTCQQILDGYQAHVDRVNRARAEIAAEGASSPQTGVR